MNIGKVKIEDFVALPRGLKDHYVNGRLTRNEFDVLIWIWVNTNAYNGYFLADYKALQREFNGRISYDNIRKIISSLRQKQYIHFLNHKGKKGSFPIYPIDFLLTSGNLQTIEYIKNKLLITTKNHIATISKTQIEHKRGEGYHNFNSENKFIYTPHTKNSNPTITTPYNNTDNDNKNNKKESSSNKRKPYFRGMEMRYSQNKWWCIPKDGGDWLEFAGEKSDIEWK